MKKQVILMLILLVVPLVSAFIDSGEDLTEAELAQMNLNNSIFVIILAVSLALIAIIYYLLNRKNFKKERKKNGKKRNS